jgi:hypothetical protein
MATILLGAAGAAVGSAFSGTVLGLTGAVIGRAVGATLGRVIDQRLLGAGSEAVESGRVERYRLMGASEGAPLGLVFGRMRVAGQVIWATRFREERTTSGGGKGAPRPSVTEFSYSVSLAIALGEGVVDAIGRIWADGIEIEPGRLNLRLYTGSEDQLPDPRIEAVEGAGLAPAYRGVAYVVIEDLGLADFGNRVPQFAFEVIRPAQPAATPGPWALRDSVRAVAMMPGTGEYALATTRVHYDDEPGRAAAVNVHAPTGKSDFATSLDQLRAELPNVGSVSLIVSWFGDDLRCGNCQVQPKVEQSGRDGVEIPWRAGGIARAQAAVVPVDEGLSIYGGTPADGAVIEAIRAIRDGGQKVMFYPFILMEQLAGNGLPDPYGDAAGQPVLPWRGRITTSVAAGRAGTPDRTAAAEAEVAAFFGTAAPGDFVAVNGRIVYSGPAEWRYRRFILHYAHLCALAGGVDAFCIGSEMRGLTQIRGAGDSFPAVSALVQLAAEVRAILGPAAEISYAADWTEYAAYQADGNLYFPLDPLWASADVDFVGIDNYMPLSDWRGLAGEADAAAGSPYALDYLAGNVAGGEGFDWFYDSPEGRAAQRRLPIEDGAHGEPWVFRVKDLGGWWSNLHHPRTGGARAEMPTPWVPGSKPIRFTEYGCAAVDKGTNEPNRFLDPKSSESGLPAYSDGRRDDAIQQQYYRAMARHFAEAANNPVSATYGGPMVQMDQAHAWAWDARPFPAFPGNADLWSDAANYPRGHWLIGRATHQSLAGVLAELSERSGVVADVGRAHGVVRGFAPEGVGTARAAIQALMLAQAFDAVERDGALAFRMRGEVLPVTVDPGRLAVEASLDGAVEVARAPEAEVAGAVRLAYVEAEGDFATRQAEAVFPDETARAVSQTDLAMLLTPAEARGITERWLAEARVAREGARFALPPSAAALGSGDVVALDGALWRIDRLETAGPALAEAVRVEPAVYRPSDDAEERVVPRPFTPPVPVLPLFLDLPLITGEEVPHAPHVAAVAEPWPGSVAVWAAPGSDGFALNTLIAAASVIGVTETALPWARPGLWDRGPALRVRLTAGALAAADETAVLNGANLMAIGDGSSDRWELFQFAGATLVAPRTWDLDLRLRGQLGTESVAPAGWPAGSRVVLLDGVPQQISLALSARGLARTYRIGASARGFDDPDVTERVEAFLGIGLRPYAPVHLRAAERADGGLDLTWFRRTRIEGDSWESLEVPLGEDREAYLVRVFADATLRREIEVAVPGWTYGAAERALDAGFGALTVEVAQLSDRFGAGVFRSLALP